MLEHEYHHMGSCSLAATCVVMRGHMRLQLQESGAPHGTGFLVEIGTLDGRSNLRVTEEDSRARVRDRRPLDDAIDFLVPLGALGSPKGWDKSSA